MPGHGRSSAALRTGLAALCCFHASVAHAEGTIAAAAPLSGPYAELGQAVRDGLAEANGSGAEPAPKVLDDKCQAAAAVEIANQLIATRPAAVIGHPCSSAAIAAAPVYAAAQIPFISTGARHGALTDQRAGPLVFRLAGRDDRQGAAAADHLLRLAGGRPIAILHDRTFAMSSIAADAAKALPGANVMQFPFVASELDYDALAAKVTAFATSPDNAGAILFAGFTSEALIILRTLRAKGVTAPFVAVEAAATAEFGRALGPSADGVFVLTSAQAGAPAVRQLAAAAMRVWRAAVAKTPDNPGGALQEISIVDPALGAITFDAKGDAMLPSYFLSAWKDGAWALPGREDNIPIP